MKKIIAVILTLVLCMLSVSALAAGKLNVAQENYYTIASYWTCGYVFAKVENVGDKAIKVNAGLLEVYDANGAPLTSTDYMSSYAEYLQPGEYTYVSLYSEIETGEAADYMLTVSGKSDNSYVTKRLPVTAEYQPDVSYYSWYDTDYMYATVTNDTEDTLYDVTIVMALLDADGNILYMDSKSLYDEVGILPGTAIALRLEVPSDFGDYMTANSLTPASVDAIAYVNIEQE